jgi:hypothetical protein
MNTEKIAEVVDMLEKAEDILRHEPIVGTDMQQLCEGIVWSLRRNIRTLKNELHYAEKRKLAAWVRSNTASTGLGLSAAKSADTEPEVSPVAATGSQPSR